MEHRSGRIMCISCCFTATVGAHAQTHIHANESVFSENMCLYARVTKGKLENFFGGAYIIASHGMLET